MSKARSLRGFLTLVALLVSLGGCRGQEGSSEQTANPAATSSPSAVPVPTGTPAVSAVPGDFDGCPPEGTALGEHVRRLNEFKNRSAAPSEADIDHSVTLAALLAPGDDHSRWNEDRAAEMVGYVVRVLPGGKETTNCGALDRPHRDTHIELVLSPSDSAKNRRVIVEVTPRWRTAMQDQGVDWSTDHLKVRLEGQWVKIRGWLFFDAEHWNHSENTASGNPSNWRATAWEIHPITSIEVLPAP